MLKRKSHRGNTLALILVALGVVLMLLVVFALNYNQLFGGHKQAVSAIDAAALAAAQDMTRVVVNGPLGRVGLVDDTPAFNPPAGGSADSRPIVGVNTLMATLRLDALIASQLQTSPNGANDPSDANAPNAPNGNTSIIYLVQQDFNNALLASQEIAQQLSGTGYGAAKDKYGLPINIQADASAAYSQNNRSLAGVQQSQPAVTVTLGYVSGSATSNAPTPQPVTSDPVMKALGGGSTYPVYQNVAAAQSGPAAVLNFQFVPLANSLALIPNNQFSASPPSGASSNLPPTAVQVACTQTITANAQLQKSGHGQTSGTLNLTASAEAGGTIETMPSGAFVVSFASGGIPGLAQSTGSGPVAGQSMKLQQAAATGVDFTSVATLMNASMADAGTGASGDGPWMPQSTSPGFWFQAQGGAVPGSGSLQQYPYKGISGQSNANPSVVLSYLVYDWLKSLGLRPNVQSMVSALTFNAPSSQTPASFYALENQLVAGNGNSTTQYKFSISSASAQPFSPLADLGRGWMPPAYADSSNNAPGVVGALEDININNPNNDSRNLKNYGSKPEDYQRQQSNAWGYVPAETSMLSQAQIVHIANGQPTTSNGQPVTVLYEFWNALKKMTDVADATQLNAYNVLQMAFQQINSSDTNLVGMMKQKSQLESQLKASPNNSQLQGQVAQLGQQIAPEMSANMAKAAAQVPRAHNALLNAQYCLSVSKQITGNMNALTGIGVTETSFQHFVVGGSDFWPASQPASVAQLKSTGAVPTGQASGAPNADWCTPLSGNNTSRLDFLKRSQAPVIGAGHHGGYCGSWLQPAYAAAASSQNPYALLRFTFFVTGSTPGQGEVYMTCGQSPFSSESTLSGQQVYQDVHALSTNTEVNPTVTVSTSYTQGNIGPAGSTTTTTTNPTTGATTTTTVDTYYISIPYMAQTGSGSAANQTANGGTYSIAGGCTVTPGGSVGVQSVTTTTLLATSSTWQVQARDEAANAYPPPNPNGSASTQSGATYFADMQTGNGANTISPADWCQGNQNNGSSPYPQCPALAAEWQLTCPIPITSNETNGSIYYPPNIVYHAATPPSQSIFLGGYYWNTGGLTDSQAYSAGGNTWNSGYCHETNFYVSVQGTQQSYLSAGGVDFATGTPGNSIQTGNGWSVISAPQCGVVNETTQVQVLAIDS